MRLRYVLVILFLAAVTTGCGHRAAPPAPKAKPAAKESVPLPDWAPRNPSPEFLRAARVLRPVPEEKFNQTPEEQSAALAARLVKILPAGYEYFGTLSDQQVAQLKSSGKLLIPVKSLTAKQRAGLDGYIRAYNDAMRGLAAQPGFPKASEDLLVILYEFGAKEDLSNVDVGFGTVGRSVNTKFRVRLAGGRATEFFGNTLGTI